MIEQSAIRCGEVYNLETPGYLLGALADEGGANLYGEPMYRLVWGWSRHELRAGEFHEFDDSGNWVGAKFDVRMEPRYYPRDRFHLEVWMPPGIYGTPEEWYAVTRRVVGGRFVEHLGEYPSRGEYEHVCVCQTRLGEFVMPTEQAVRDVVRWHQTARLRTSGDIRKEITMTEDEKKEARRRMARDVIDGNVKAFPWRTWTPVPGLARQPVFAN